ncbi:MAG: hypothetical protein M3082_01950 [Candidatus Dormibacteraeota bacterium]|nr:hypothetical protein [Candidatus Dormibacteraeota bacterium]
MRKYTFKLDQYQIKTTRSRHKDTNYISAALTVKDNETAAPVTKGTLTRFMGDQNDGFFPVGFSWDNLEVPEGGLVTMTYQIMNSGHKDHAKAEKALTEVVTGQSSGSESSGGTLKDLLLEFATGLLLVDCDGPIAPPEGRHIVWHTFELNPMVPGTTGSDTINEHGNDSPVGCGKNSHYIVHVSVDALA